MVRVLLLLGCLPLLHPPGVCACEVLAAVLPGAGHGHDAHHGGECPHCPGATADTDRPRPADPAPDPAAASAPVVVAAFVPAPPVVQPPPARTSAAWPSAPPLFLSHCALTC